MWVVLKGIPDQAEEGDAGDIAWRGRGRGRRSGRGDPLKSLLLTKGVTLGVDMAIFNFYVVCTYNIIRKPLVTR